MKKQGRGAKALTVFKYTLALLATVALLKIAFFPANDEDYAQATGDFSQPTTELSPQRINNTQKLSATIVPDEPTVIRANASGEITDAFVNSGGNAVEGQNLLQVKKTSVSETASTSGGADSADENAAAAAPETTVTWGNITAKASGTVQWDIVIGQTVEIGQEIGTISPNSFHAVAPIKPSQLYTLGDSINNGRLAITDGPAPFLCDSVKTVTGSGAGSQNTDAGEGAGMGAAAAGNSSGGPQLRCDIPADQTVYEGVPATLILGSSTTSEVPALPVTAVEGRFREGVVYAPAKDGGKPTKIKVELGANDGTFIEIKRGLKEGQQVLEYVPSYKDEFAGDGSGDGTGTGAGDGSDTGFDESGDDAGSEK